ncbi:GGDEF domain-containing protein [Desulfurispira natronophila]|uniref:Thiamine pyrimidine synthase n=1 Tax=Desulfurispira natronophila TaxID=682562 RepID=A0A7W7Y3A7_9BACT|nr:GGDEF domain-containing protein [Desulfurispira natronophila]MBB5021248.1 diguanylate cyclase (GGDEF)-like protein/PAS domain S-box-containing protein [Desulfurispira natronophila]
MNIIRATIVPCATLLLLLIVLPASHARDSVTLQLSWYHQFQFAGYYAALEKGFYQEEGLDVTIREGGGAIQAVQAVLERNADFGVHSADLLIKASKGEPLVALAPVFQQSAYVLIVESSSPIQTPQDLEGRTVMISQEKRGEFLAMLHKAGLSVGDVNLIPKDTSALVKLASQEVDAISGNVAADPIMLEQMGLNVRIIQPSQHSVDVYGDTLFTSRNMVERNPQLVEAFIRATVRGWEYAFAHQDEMVDLIASRYNTDKSREHLHHEAQSLKQLILPDLVQIGHVNPDRWKNMARLFSEAGLMGSSEWSMEDFLYNVDFPPTYGNYFWLVWVLVGLILVVLVALLLLYLFNKRLRHDVATRTDKLDQMNRALIREITERRQVEEELRNNLQFLGAFLDTIPSPVFYQSEQGVYLACNDAFAKDLLGLDKSDVEGRSLGDFNDLLPTDDIERELERDRQLFSDKLPQAYEANFTVHTGECHNFAFSKVAYYGVSGKFQGIIGVMLNITSIRNAERELQEQELRLHHMKYHDSLTGLPNRLRFYEYLRQHLHSSRLQSDFAAVMVLSVDRFREINKQVGNRGGDEALQILASRLQSCVRGDDMVARVDGDTFAIFLGDIDDESVPDIVLERIQSYVSTGVAIAPSRQINITVSVGVSFAPRNGTSAEELTRRAEQAMEEVKRSGGNGIKHAQG